MTRTLFSRPRRAALVTASALLLAACGSLIGPSEPPPQLYILHPALGAIGDAAQIDAQITVSPPVVSDVLDTKRIALKRGQTMDYYANSAWTDQTPDLLQGLLVEALEQSGKAKAVGRVSSGVRPDYILVTEVHDFAAHYDGEAAPKIVVDVVAKLVTATRHDVVGTYDAHREAQASANSVPAVVDAFNEASGAALEDIAGFALNSAGPPAPTAKSDDPPPAPAARHRRHHRH